MLNTLKFFREDYDVDHEFMNLYERQKNRVAKVLKTIINAQKQTKTFRQTLSINQEFAIDFQIEIDDFTEQLINQQNVNVLIEQNYQKRQNSTLFSLSASILKIFSASINVIVNFKRSIKHFDFDKFTDDINDRDHFEFIFDD